MTARTKVSRRRFVTLVAGGTLALAAAPAAAEESSRSRRKRTSAPSEKPAPPPPPAPTATEKEFERQRQGLLGTIKTLRGAKLSPGGDLPVVFQPMRVRRGGR